jgi:hypothetical protein
MTRSTLIKEADFRAKVWHLLLQAEGKGLIKSELLMATRAKAEDLDTLLAGFVTAGDVVARLEPKSKPGRQPMRYWHVKVAPPLLLAQIDGTLSAADESETVGPSIPCQQCGRAIVVQGPGRRPTYCSSTCKKLASERSALTAFLARAPSDHARMLAALHFVSMDLIYRGFNVAFDHPATVLRLIVTDTESAMPLYVYALGEHGVLPANDAHNAFAAVSFDGQITYGGKTPIVLNPEDELPFG